MIGMKYSFDARLEFARRLSAIFQRPAANFSMPTKWSAPMPLRFCSTVTSMPRQQSAVGGDFYIEMAYAILKQVESGWQMTSWSRLADCCNRAVAAKRGQDVLMAEVLRPGGTFWRHRFQVDLARILAGQTAPRRGANDLLGCRHDAPTRPKSLT